MPTMLLLRESRDATDRQCCADVPVANSERARGCASSVAGRGRGGGGGGRGGEYVRGKMAGMILDKDYSGP